MSSVSTTLWITSMPIVTLLTDFGTADGYVGAMKGAIKTVSANIDIIDVTHDIPAFSITRAAYTILNYYNRFPKDTVHVCVVDPGVGSGRGACIIQADRAFFVGPDNGMFDLLLAEQPSAKCFSIHNNFAESSSTFHGRDIFAPVAARLATGISPELLSKPVPCNEPKIVHVRHEGNKLYVPVLVTDHFGNIIFAVKRKKLAGKRFRKIRFKNYEFTKIREYYSQKKPGGLLCLWNSLNFLEIAQNKGSAADFFSVSSGDELELHLDET